MKKVYLFCSAGMSTSLLAQKMQDAANARGLEMEIQARPIAEVDNFAGQLDAFALGPQVRFMEAEVKSKVGDSPVVVLPMNIYGLMDGEKALDCVLDVIK